MVDTVMTIGRTYERTLIRGSASPSVPIGGDFREIPFRCRFSAGAVNSGATEPGENRHRKGISRKSPPIGTDGEADPRMSVLS